jgi:hypothetical protein
VSKMVRCACGNAWVPEGMCCVNCEPFADEEPIVSSPPEYTDEDKRIDAMEEDGYWFGEMGVWSGDDREAA